MSVRFVLMAAVSLLVTACSKNPLEVVVSNCPAVAVVGDVGTITRFLGEGRTSKDVAYTASILDVSSTCREDKDKKTGGVSSRVVAHVAAQRGEAFKSDEISLTYFVAVLKDNSRIVSKEIYTTTVKFDENGDGRVREVLAQEIPSIQEARRYDYEILIGFQANPQDAVYNMQR